MTDYSGPLGTQYSLVLTVVLDTSYGTGGYDIATNTSRVIVQLRAYKNTGSGFSSGDATYWGVWIDGVPTGAAIGSYDFTAYSVLLIANYTQVISHTADGSKIIAVSGQWNANNPPELSNSGAVGGTFTLPTIPRATTPTFSASTVNAGTSVTINLPRASTGFTHDVTYTFGTATGTIATGAGASTTWTPPMSLLNEIPNTLSGSAQIKVVTKNGATVIGEKTVPLTIAVPSSVVPDFTTITHAETVSTIASVVGAYVQGKSKLALAITGAVGAYGSTIGPSGYRIEVASQVFLTASATTAEIAATGTLTISATVTDSRNRTVTKTVSITVLAYAAPAITAMQIRRALAGGTLDDNGTYMRVDLVAAVQSLVVGTQKNALEYRISTKLRSTPSWTVPSWVVPGGVGFASYALPVAVAVNQSRDVRVEVRDALGTISTVQGVLGTAGVQMDLPDGFDAVAFGQRYDVATGGSVQAAGRIFQRGTKQVVDLDDAATELARGVVELATTAEVQAGTDTTRVVTPAGLAARTATATRAGVVELATTAEAAAGTDTVRAVTPQGLVEWHKAAPIAYRAAAGSVASGSSVGSNTVTFPSGRFSQVPVVNVVPRNTAVNVAIAVTAVSSTSMTVTVYDSTGAGFRTGIGFDWTAVQMTPTSGVG